MEWFDLRDLRIKGMRKQARSIDVQGNVKSSYNYNFKNTSLWPDLIVRRVVDWVLGEAESRGLDGKSSLHTINVTHTNRGGHGYAYWSGKIHVSHNRYAPRHDWKYVGIKWANDNETKTALQSLVHIISHEIIHTTKLVEITRTTSGRLQSQKYEYRTDNLTAEFVAKFAAEYEQTFWNKYRKTRRTQRNAMDRSNRSADSRKTSDHKLRLAENNLDRWLAEHEKAKKMVAKYRTKVNRIKGGMKAAATRKKRRG